MQAASFPAIFPLNLPLDQKRPLSLLFFFQKIQESLETIHSFQENLSPSKEEFLQSIHRLSHLHRWHKPPGLLDTLKYYTEATLKAFEKNTPSIFCTLFQNMDHYLKQTLLLFQQEGLSKRVLEKIQNLYDSLKKSLIEMFQHALTFVPPVKDNENVVLYLLENSAALNYYLEEPAIDRLFTSLFPQGPVSLHCFLKEAFSRRGFSSCYEQKEHLIDTIQWERPCVFAG